MHKRFLLSARGFAHGVKGPALTARSITGIMSRIGKKLIEIPSGVTVGVSDGVVTVKGQKGELKRTVHPLVHVVVTNNEVTCSVGDETDKKTRALWGTFGSHITNMIEGVTQGYEKKLEVNGVGYRAEVRGKELVLQVGYSHPVHFAIPQGIAISVEKNVLTVNGIDKELVGETCAQIRKIRLPEPYKGKGIKYVDEVLRRKAGKAGKAAA